MKRKKPISKNNCPLNIWKCIVQAGTAALEIHSSADDVEVRRITNTNETFTCECMFHGWCMMT